MKHLCSCPFDSLTLSPMNISSTSFQLFTSYDAGYVQTLSLAETVPLWVLYFKYFPLQPYFSIFFKLTCLIAFNNTILWLPWPFRYSNYICPSLSTSTSLLTSYIPGIILSLLQIPPWTHLPPLSFSHSLGNFPVLVEPSTWKTNHLTEKNVIF